MTIDPFRKKTEKHFWIRAVVRVSGSLFMKILPLFWLTGFGLKVVINLETEWGFVTFHWGRWSQASYSLLIHFYHMLSSSFIGGSSFLLLETPCSVNHLGRFLRVSSPPPLHPIPILGTALLILLPFKVILLTLLLKLSAAIWPLAFPDLSSPLGTRDL